MNLIEKALKNPFVKIIGIGLVLYFALLNNKDNPESLGNRFSKEKVSKNLNQAKQQSTFIIKNLKEAQDTQNQQQNEQANQ